MPAIPIIDLSSVSGADIKCKGSGLDDKNLLTVADKFIDALCSHGFTYILNHGIPNNKVHETFEISRRFFSLPTELKMKYKADPQRHYHGYARRVHKHGGFQDLRETFDCAGLERFYPVEVNGFQKAMEELEKEAKRVFKLLLKLLAIGLRIDDDYFLSKSKHLFENSISSSANFRSLYYPAISEEVELASDTVRTKEHTDYGLITMLFQDDIGGLEVKLKSGEWIPVEPIPDSLVVNVGDLMEFWTGSFIRATAHRVLIPGDSDKRKVPRQSLAYFTHPDDDVVIQPIKSELIEYPHDFEPVTSYEFVMRKLAQVY